jgi:LysR family transcriptional regulator, glycine cleavage system transcriptional activator
MRRVPPLKALPAFDIAAGTLSFSATAKELHLTHGAVSRQIKAIEDYLGTALFARRNRSLELTAAGVSFASAVRQALQIIESGAAPFTVPSKRGPLVVSCLPTFMMRWLIPRLSGFGAAHPDIEVRLSASHLPVDFADGGVDVAIRVGAPPWPRGVVAEPFLINRMGPVLAPALARKHRLKQPDDLKNLPLLHVETRPQAWPQWLKLAGVKNFDADAGARLEHVYFLLEAAASGLGVAIGPHPIVESDLKSGRLVAPFGFMPSGQSYHVLRARNAPNATKAKAFVSWIMAEANALKQIDHSAHSRANGNPEPGPRTRGDERPRATGRIADPAR